MTKKHCCSLTWSNQWTGCSGLEVDLPAFSVGVKEDNYGHFKLTLLTFNIIKIYNLYHSKFCPVRTKDHCYAKQLLQHTSGLKCVWIWWMSVSSQLACACSLVMPGKYPESSLVPIGSRIPLTAFPELLSGVLSVELQRRDNECMPKHPSTAGLPCWSAFGRLPRLEKPSYNTLSLWWYKDWWS